MGTNDSATPSVQPASKRLTIPRRFRGPPNVGNGGYVAGRLATWLSATGAIQVTLREPPPLDAPLDIHLSSDDAPRVSATFGGAVVAEAQPGTLSAEVVAPVTFAAAAAVMSRFAGLVEHPFADCFVCGTTRGQDGMALHPGRLRDRPDTVATTWIPTSSFAEEGRLPAAMVWAALDCPGGWSAHLEGRPMVLGRITASVDAVPEVGDRCVVLGQFRERSGRKTFTSSTAYDEDGRILGRAESIWFDVDLTQFAASP